VYKGKEKERRQKESGIEKVVRAASSIGRFWLLDECRVLFSFPAVVWVFYSAVDQNHAVDQHARRWKGKKTDVALGFRPSPFSYQRMSSSNRNIHGGHPSFWTILAEWPSPRIFHQLTVTPISRRVLRVFGVGYRREKENGPRGVMDTTTRQTKK
jgi:hypothetical protein